MMVNVPPNLPPALFFAGGVVPIVIVFMNFNNHDVTSHIQEKVRPSLGSPFFYLLVTLPGDIGEFFFKKSYNSVLLRLVVPCNRLIRKQMDKAKQTVSIILSIFMGSAMWGLSQPTTATILTIAFLFAMLTNTTTSTFLTFIFLPPMVTKVSTTTFLTTTFSNRMRTNALPTTFRTVIHVFPMQTALFV